MGSLLCETRSYSDVSHTHYHLYSQLILPLHGSLIIDTKKHELRLDKNHLLFLPPKSSHRYYAKKHNQFLVLDIPSKLNPYLTSKDTERYEQLSQKWQHLKQLLLQESQSNNKRSLKPLVNYAISLLCEEKMPISIQYIHNNIDQQIPLKVLAAIENFNISHYIEWFHKKTGLTPNYYIQKLRVEKCKDFLINTHYSLLTIANLVGYEHQSSLTRVFKQHENTTPNQYRKLYREIAKNTLN